MKFQEAIISVINDYGKDILLKSSIINILSDYNAFEESKSFKVILKHIISEGYLEQILYLKNWENSHSLLIKRFVENTGFQSDKAFYVVSSLSYALGISQTFAIYNRNHPQQQPSLQPIFNNTTTNISQSDLNLTSSKLEKLNDDNLVEYKEKAEKYLESIIEYKGNTKKELGTDIVVTCDFDCDNSLKFRMEINGAIKYQYEYIYFYFVIYNNAGRVINTISAYCDKMSKNYQILETCYSFEKNHKTVGNISKIIMYWDY